MLWILNGDVKTDVQPTKIKRVSTKIEGVYG